jgi:hypothetical protein
MKEIEEMNLSELAAFVCDFLFKNGIKCVLSGGAVVSIYTNNRYQSGDLDFIENGTYSRKEIINLMNKIGFIEKQRYFVHPKQSIFIEFPTGPLAIGSEPVREISELEFSTGTLRLLTPTDCVKDRLAAYYFWDDKQALEQALMVTNDHKIDINEVQRWSKTENSEDKFKLFYNFVIKNCL